MTGKPKIFISYSTDDRTTAEAIYSDLSQAGAEVFQFEESKTPGTDAWDEVMKWIEESDVFIILTSKSALKSRPVRLEINSAYHLYANTTKPMLLPLILEPDLRLPLKIRTLNRISFEDYQNGIQQLIKFLNLFDTPALTVRNDLESATPTISTPYLPSSSELLESTAVVLGKYIALISGITVLSFGFGVSIISLVGRVSVSIGFRIPSGILNILESWVPYFPLSLMIIVYILIVAVTWISLENGWPIDSFDYVRSTTINMSKTLFIVSVWNFLFYSIAGEVFTYVLISFGLTGVTTILYAIFREL